MVGLMDTFFLGQAPIARRRGMTPGSLFDIRGKDWWPTGPLTWSCNTRVADTWRVERKPADFLIRRRGRPASLSRESSLGVATVAPAIVFVAALRRDIGSNCRLRMPRLQPRSETHQRLSRGDLALGSK